MNAIAIAVTTTAVVFVSGVAGTRLGRVLPEHHISQDSKDVVKVGAGFIGTLAALVLGLLVASAKGAYDAKFSEIQHTAAQIIVLDRLMRDYGPPADPIRAQLRELVAKRHSITWISHEVRGEASAPGEPPTTGAERMRAAIAALSPVGEGQRTLQARLLQTIDDFMQIRWLFVAQTTDSVSVPLLVVLVSWLAAISLCTGLFAPRNATVALVAFICSASAGAAIFLIVEMYQPFEGVMRISDAPLRAAMNYLGR